jgi:signal transduction histidine kinase
VPAEGVLIHDVLSKWDSGRARDRYSGRACMPRFIATYLAGLDSAYRDRSYFVGLKARLLAYFSLLLLVFAPLNIGKLFWIHAPHMELRAGFNIFMAAVAVLCLRWVRNGRNELASNCLVLATTLSVHALLLLPSYAEPLSAAILVFAFDLVFLLLALVFATRLVAIGVMVVVVASQVAFYLTELQEPISGSIKFASDTLLRDGLISLGLVFCLGVALVRMIEAAHDRSEESLMETRTVNQNLGNLVAERTRELELAIQRANEASRAKSDFLANISHEIRTPLNGIVASADLLQRGEALSPATARHVRVIADSGELLLKQLGDILDFSKIEAGKMEIHKEPWDIIPVVQESCNGWKLRADFKKVSLNMTAPAGPLVIAVDKIRFLQILSNLLNNAAKFTPEGGRIDVAVEEEKDAVRFSVSDSGPGIAPEDMPKLFQKFQQFKRTHGPGARGTGLGLSIVKSLVELHGGEITVKSTVGKGSTFTFRLPKGTAPLATKEAVHGSQKDSDR